MKHTILVALLLTGCPAENKPEFKKYGPSFAELVRSVDTLTADLSALQAEHACLKSFVEELDALKAYKDSIEQHTDMTVKLNPCVVRVYVDTASHRYKYGELKKLAEQIELEYLRKQKCKECSK